MKTVNGYTLKQTVLDSWKERFIPENQILFFREAPGFIPSEKYLPGTSKSFTLDERTAFATWSVSKEGRYIARIEKDTFLELNEGQRKKVIREQWLLQRGLVFTEEEIIQFLRGAAHTDENLKVLELSSFVDENTEMKVFMLQQFLWNMLSSHVQSQFLLNYAELWVDDYAAFANLKEPDQQQLTEEYEDLSVFFDTFPSKNGPNCLSAAAAGFSGDKDIIEEWMMPDRFQALLNYYGYRPIDNVTPEKSDVMVWRDEQNEIMHACFLLNNEYSFNKHGQTMFNPWQVLAVNEVLNTWNREGSYLVYRKG
ncbi:hypothetical protein ACQCVK_16460 [Rossellomorea vietnamensis]|uniref:Uncharacterized protein n=1 Tax=Rossellomorea aquimaris TaxID=189382 RepID=A0A5D4TY19_9BACI|nr:hypothetical protein [Rossellomorea aquimaris]TYS79883.1 hypothetical protein FZC80_09635 [Rossellomorea aquimaris]